MSETSTIKTKPAVPTDQGTAANERVLRLDISVYDAITAGAKQARSRFDAANVFGAEKEKVESFLFWEARLLDSKKYRDWIALLSDDFIYWIPSSPDVVDPRVEGAVNFDDRRRMIDRVTLIETNIQWAQVPRSRTCRMLSNIEVFSGSGGLVHARSNFTISEYRRPYSQTYVGWQEHELLPTENGFLIKRKLIDLLDCDQPQGNTTFIL
jgi:3-phenylpropionate/cinnamic acid dioxygenase small subunit